jgi:hypothetical protein
MGLNMRMVRRNFATLSTTVSPGMWHIFFFVLRPDEILSLKNKYKPLKAKFSATGAGVVPLDDTSAKNLQGECPH